MFLITRSVMSDVVTGCVGLLILGFKELDEDSIRYFMLVTANAWCFLGFGVLGVVASVAQIFSAI